MRPLSYAPPPPPHSLSNPSPSHKAKALPCALPFPDTSRRGGFRRGGGGGPVWRKGNLIPTVGSWCRPAAAPPGRPPCRGLLGPALPPSHPTRGQGAVAPCRPTPTWRLGLGFLTSLIFIFLVGIFVSSWVGSTVFWVGEWFIKKMPFVRHIYSASKQVSTVVSPDQNTTAFKEVAIISHPCVGEYAFGFITSTMVLQTEKVDEDLCSVYVPTNHLYIDDIFLVNSEEIIRPNLSIREGIEITVSGGMTMPQVIASPGPTPNKSQSTRLNRMMTALRLSVYQVICSCKQGLEVCYWPLPACTSSVHLHLIPGHDSKFIFVTRANYQ